jgi:hypothetical protein
MNKPELETDKVHITLLDNSVFRILVKEDAKLDVNDLDRNYFFYLEHKTEPKALFLIVFEKGATTEKGATEKFFEKGRMKIKRKEAIVVSTLPHRIMANLYVGLTKRSHPTKIFSNEDDAIKWLKE